MKTTVFQKISLFILGLLISLAALEGALRVAEFAFFAVQSHRNNQSTRNEDIVILCLGESTTAMEDGHSYPRQLEAILNQRDLGNTFRVINKGVPGIYTEGILAQLPKNLQRYQPDIVIAMMGVNDPLRGAESQNKPSSIESRNWVNTLKVVKLIAYIRDSYTKGNRRSWGDAIYLKGNEQSFEFLRQGHRKLSLGEVDAANDLFRQSIAADPTNHEAYAALADDYIVNRQFHIVEELYQKNLLHNPGNTAAYDDLAELYFFQEEYEKAEATLREVLELDETYAKAYVNMSRYRRHRGDILGAEEVLSEAVDKLPIYYHEEIYTELANLSDSQGLNGQAEEFRQQVLRLRPDSDRMYGIIAIARLQQGKPQEAEFYFKAAAQVRRDYRNPETVRNYQKLQRIITQQDMLLVAVQYPVREVQWLHDILEENDNTLVVDNAKLYKDKLTQMDFDVLFNDQFAGDFGHMTEHGSNILANHIADHIQNHLSSSRK